MNARATVTPLRAERRKTISPARRLTRPPPLKHASSPTDAAAVAPAREAGTASSSKLSVPRATATGAVALALASSMGHEGGSLATSLDLGKLWMWMQSGQSLWMDVLSCGCEGASHLDQLKMCWQIKRIHNFWCNLTGLSHSGLLTPEVSRAENWFRLIPILSRSLGEE